MGAARPPRSRRDNVLVGVVVVSLLVSTVPLAVYPFILIANLMSLSATEAQSSADVGAGAMFGKAFLWVSTAYPVVWLPSLIVSIVLSVKRSFKPAAVAALTPVVYLGLVAILYALWTGL